MNESTELPGNHLGQSKLILPSSEPMHPPGARTEYIPPIQSENPASFSAYSPLADLRAKLASLWKKDPAYKVLMISIGSVLIAGMVLSIVVVSVFSQVSATPLSLGTASPPIQQAAVGTGQVDLHPTFPTPQGGQGDKNMSSQPPVPTEQPTPTPTAVVITDQNQPTPTPQQAQGGPLQLQITDAPQQVNDNSTVTITVNATQPGVSVKLLVNYTTRPFFTSTDTQTTDGSGNASLSWHIHLTGFTNNALARVTAIGQNADGQRTASQTVTVQIVPQDNGN